MAAFVHEDHLDQVNWLHEHIRVRPKLAAGNWTDASIALTATELERLELACRACPQTEGVRQLTKAIQGMLTWARRSPELVEP